MKTKQVELIVRIHATVPVNTITADICVNIPLQRCHLFMGGESAAPIEAELHEYETMVANEIES